MKKARLFMAVVIAALAVSLSGCSETIVGTDECVNPVPNSNRCE